MEHGQYWGAEVCGALGWERKGGGGGKSDCALGPIKPLAGSD